ncbi:hypothetical protein R3P38DRAFT_2806009 [Favolaschia claudopus]|uniref:Reverse transcriptase zinc-binding domain-containing protein n=1 Tax=Favolaschia claudopus TaxID=2862362 RepID=A0AAV9ZLC6_9AGAR
MAFDPDLYLTDLSHGFRIFATEDHLTELPAKRYTVPAAEIEPVTISLNSKPSLPTALLGGLLYALQNSSHSTPATIVCPSPLLRSIFVTDRKEYENNPLNPNFRLIKSILAQLLERSAPTQFKVDKLSISTASRSAIALDVSLEIEPDLMFNLPGILLSMGSQRSFTKLIVMWKRKPIRKMTVSNLDRVRCSVSDEFNFCPSDKIIWNSLRSTDISRLTRNFLWRCMHESFRVGMFWDHIPNLEHFGRCVICGVPETLEHIALQCDARGQKTVWNLCERTWKLRYPLWPKLYWGLLLGCALPRFRSSRGSRLRGKERFFTILLSTSLHFIWKLRNERVFEAKNISETEITNRWISILNAALRRDQILTNKARFGSLAKKKGLVLETWSGMLQNEDALPEDWTQSKGVLVGIWPATRKIGVG